MPRRVNWSAKQKKLKLQDARAAKRGDETHTNKSTSKPLNPHGAQKSYQPRSNGPITTRKLTSRFLTLPENYLEETRDLAHGVVLTRPIMGESAVYESGGGGDGVGEERLSCPGRPKFRYGQTKKEVERNEEGVFGKWLEGVKGVVQVWSDGGGEGKEGEMAEEFEKEVEVKDGGEEEVKWPRGSSWFETNLEVWRQLWRVTESSSILLVLLDSRCPPLHLPRSLKAYVKALKPKKEVILVLTKSDLVDPIALEGWKEWAKSYWGGEEGEVGVVAVRSYDEELLYEGKGRHRPAIPPAELLDLIEALQLAHARLSQPPASILADEEKVKTWKSAVRSQVDWQSLLTPQAYYPPTTTEEPDVVVEGEEKDRDPEREPLTIGLIGQPNVGKSSLLNALVGESRVRASRQPGKTKHFQTIFWGGKKEVKIVDCPGLVCPSLVRLEMQALAGILPISQIPSLPACMYFASTVLPLETIFNVPTPESIDTESYAAKKTWRGPRPEAEEVVEKKVNWTAGMIMEGRALERGYLTAKGGRPDGNRAANGIMRALADGRVRWGFWPPGSDVSGRLGKGIWLDEVYHGATGVEDDKDGEGGKGGNETLSEVEESEFEDDFSSEDDGREEVHDLQLEDDEEEEEDSEEEEDDVEEEKAGKAKPTGGGGFFAALEEDESDEEEEESDDEDE